MVLPTLIDSRASSTFISNQLIFPHDTLDKLLELQLFDGSPTSTGITQYHNSALTLDINLRFQNVNLNIDWKNLTMQFLSPKASLATTISLSIQSPSSSNVPNLTSSNSRATPLTLKGI
ncbi:hypothetical protein E4T56_gene8707 [Termitomyces sp. T112]|nr:hypothetical protein E4T56_gene8707 [Termitomyces sp. T112]